MNAPVSVGTMPVEKRHREKTESPPRKTCDNFGVVEEFHHPLARQGVHDAAAGDHARAAADGGIFVQQEPAKLLLQGLVDVLFLGIRPIDELPRAHRACLRGSPRRVHPDDGDGATQLRVRAARHAAPHAGVAVRKERDSPRVVDVQPDVFGDHVWQLGIKLLERATRVVQKVYRVVAPVEDPVDVRVDLERLVGVSAQRCLYTLSAGRSSMPQCSHVTPCSAPSSEYSGGISSCAVITAGLSPLRAARAHLSPFASLDKNATTICRGEEKRKKAGRRRGCCRRGPSARVHGRCGRGL